MSIRAKLKKIRKRLASRRQRRAWLATLHRLMVPHVTYIGITGSCAKTTTTRLIGAVLERAGRCRTKDDNGISHVSRNVLSVRFDTSFCVQEIAGTRPGRIRTQTKILRPQIGVVTNVGGDHYKAALKRDWRPVGRAAWPCGRVGWSKPDGTTIYFNVAKLPKLLKR